MKSGVYDLNRFSFTFYRDSFTHMDLDPSKAGIRNIVAKVYELDCVQIFVDVSNGEYVFYDKVLPYLLLVYLLFFQ